MPSSKNQTSIAASKEVIAELEHFEKSKPGFICGSSFEQQRQ